jgi:regulator of sigma E protease
MFGMLLMIIAFISLVVIHERGHMTAAKAMGVHVTEFGIGIPPHITKLRKKSWTTYTLNLIPLGWFVRMAGDNPHDRRSFTTTWSYLAASRWRKLIILIAGIVMNILTAWIIFTILFMVGTQPLSILPDTSPFATQLMPTITHAQEQWIITINESLPATVIATQTWSRAATHNLTPQSTITHIDGTPTNINTISNQLQSCDQKPCSIERQNPDNTTEQAPYQCVNSCLLGIMLDQSESIIIHHIRYPRHQAPYHALQEIRQQTAITFSTLWQLISTLRSWSTTEKQQATSQLSWPVGIVGIGQDIIQQWARSQRWILIGMISLALWVFNLLPIPALDGGRIVGVLIQIIGRITPSRYYQIEGIINSIIMLILLVVWVLIMAKDAAQIYCRENTLTQTVFGENVTCIHEE